MNPLAGLYGTAAALRNTLFDRGVLSSRRLQRPVISVGNLSVGGTGKTPFVIALGEMLKQRGISFDVLSRGYRRQTTGVRIVNPGGTAAEFGDEPLLIARRLGAPVIVGESRYEAGRVAEREFSSDMHLLDDGFQHRALARDFDIVLMTAHDFEDCLLPTGRLREPLSALRRADAVVLPQEAPGEHPSLEGRLVWRLTRELQLPSPPSSPVAFCGIARPEQFFSQLRAAGTTPSAELAYSDHYAYDQADIDRLLAKRSHLEAGGFVTTEKDAVNLGDLCSQLDPLSIARLQVHLDRPADAVDTILARIRDRKPGS